MTRLSFDSYFFFDHHFNPSSLPTNLVTLCHLEMLLTTPVRALGSIRSTYEGVTLN